MSFITFPARIEGASYKNTGIGFDALYRVVPAPPQGEDNTAFGYAALQLNTSGDSNTAVGSGALSLNITGRKNTAIGENVLDSNDSGEFNTSIGANSLSSATDADYNVAVGANALLSFSSAGLTGNTAIGAGAGQLITTGTKNTILGRYNGNQGGLDIRTLNNYCVISDGDGNPRIIVDPAGLVSAPGGFSGGGGGGGAITIDNKTAAYTVVASDLGKVINCTANSFNVLLTAAATLGAGFNCWIWNTSINSTNAITIIPASGTIDGVSSLVLRRGEGTQIVCDGVNWQTGDKKTMRYYAENCPPSSSRPSALGDQSIAVGGGAVAQNTGCVAIGSGATAQNNYATAIGNNAGNGAPFAVNSGAVSIAGSYASGNGAFAAAIGSNSPSFGATGNQGIAIGQLATASGTGTVAIGGNGVLATSAGAVALGGSGLGASAAGIESFATGEAALAANIYGKEARANGRFSVGGDAQRGEIVLRRATSDVAPVVLTSNGLIQSGTNQVILPNTSAFAFSGIVVARQQSSGGTQSAAWKVEGLIRREGTAASTTLVASTVSVISNVPGWTLALSADTTNGGLAVTATGAAATLVRWVATIEAAEVIYL